MKKTVYFCDWCEVQSPLADGISFPWKTITTGEVLCGICDETREKAIRNAFDSRRPKK